MSLLILESYETVDLPLPDATPTRDGSPNEQERKIAFWTNALLQAVPLEDLRGAFDAAVASHADPRRPVNPFDVKLGYGELLAQREQRKRAAVERESLDDQDGAGCSFCGPERVASIYFPATNTEIVAPCRECRPAAFSTFMEQYRERRPAPEPGVEQVLKAGRKILGQELKCGNAECGRVVNTYLTTHKPGGPCRNLLNRYTSDEGEPRICDGTLEPR